MGSNTAAFAPAPVRHFAVQGLTVRCAHGVRVWSWSFQDEDDLTTVLDQLVSFGYAEVPAALIVAPVPQPAQRTVRYPLACTSCRVTAAGFVHLHGACPTCADGELDCAACEGEGFVDDGADLTPCSACQPSGKERFLRDHCDAIMEVGL